MLRFIPPAVLGAGLLFLVQPLVARALLPAFGGSAAVWTTCQLFFQVALLAGYGWTHAIVARLTPQRQRAVQLGLVAAALLALTAGAWVWGAPLAPAVTLGADDAPIPRLLLALLLAAGLPYFALATTAPLVQAWATHATPGSDVYRLYAASNLGSLAGLFAYPLVLEPLLPLKAQGAVWAAAFLAWGAWLAFASRGLAGRPAPAAVPPAGPLPWGRWLVLSAAPVALLLAVTNHVCQEVAPVPFLWVLPLAVYLVSFVAAFGRSTFYRRDAALMTLACVTLGVVASFYWEKQIPIFVRLAVPVAYLFVACFTCHAELHALRPEKGGLTGFYAALAAGGALGGLAVGIFAPLVFAHFYEVQVGLVFALAALSFATREQWLWLVTAGVAVAAAFTANRDRENEVETRRDFYGVVRVLRHEAQGGVTMMSGVTAHGAQRFADRRVPTLYYWSDSLVGRLLSAPGAPRRVGAIGMGIGTVAAYGRPGDVYRFYELSPAVLELAQSEHFTYLRDATAAVELVPGDARTSLTREAPQGYHVLVVDAFSGAAVPVHLLTREAMQLYARHLAPGGVIAVHVSNKVLNLIPVVARAGREAGFDARLLDTKASRANASWALPAKWLLLTRGPIEPWPEPSPVVVADTAGPLWTDDHSALWPIVNW